MVGLTLEQSSPSPWLLLPQKRMTHHCPLSLQLGAWYRLVCPIPFGPHGVPLPPEKDDSPLHSPSPRKGWLTTAPSPLDLVPVTDWYAPSPWVCRGSPSPRKRWLSTASPLPQKKITYHCSLSPPLGACYTPVPPHHLGQQGVPRLPLPLVSITYWYDPHLCDVDDIWLMVVAVNLCFTSLFSTKDLLSDIVIR